MGRVVDYVVHGLLSVEYNVLLEQCLSGSGRSRDHIDNSNP